MFFESFFHKLYNTLQASDTHDWMSHTLYKEAVPSIHGDCRSKHTNLCVEYMYKARRKKEKERKRVLSWLTLKYFKFNSGVHVHAQHTGKGHKVATTAEEWQLFIISLQCVYIHIWLFWLSSSLMTLTFCSLLVTGILTMALTFCNLLVSGILTVILLNDPDIWQLTSKWNFDNRHHQWLWIFGSLLVIGI